MLPSGDLPEQEEAFVFAIEAITNFRLSAGAQSLIVDAESTGDDPMALTLVLGNKNYSSWSMRPWIGLKLGGIAFDEVVVPLYEPGSAERILAFSPAGKV